LQEKIKKAGTGESSNVMADEKFEVLFVCCEIKSPELNIQLFPKVLRLLSDPNIWIGDTGASVNMTPYPEGLIDTHPSDISVHVGNNSYTPATLCGKLPVIVCDNSGVEQYGASFSDMHLVPQPYNIISITQRMESGWRLGGNRTQGIVLEKDGLRMCFDIRIETAKGVLWAGCMKRRSVESMASAPALSRLTIQQAHGRLGHISEESTRRAAKALGWNLIPGSLSPCESCAIGKGRQKNVPKDTGGPMATKAASRAYLDCTLVKWETFGD
jgi:hypothetical protein